MPVSIAKNRRQAAAVFADRRRNPDGKRDAVLRTALGMFIERGYRQTSLDEVAVKLKITKPALYNYFHSKEAIYLECYRRGIALMQSSLEQINRNPGNGLDRVADFIRAYTRILADEYGRFLVRQDDRELSRKAQMEVHAEKRKIDEMLRGLLQQGMNDGSIRQCNVKLAAFSVAGAINSLATWFEPGGELTAEQIADEFAQSLTFGLAVANKSTNGAKRS